MRLSELMADALAVVRMLIAGGVLATALGHGRPAVVTDIGGLPDAIAEHGAGRVVPADDAPALAAAIRELLEPAALSAAFEGAQAARRALTWDAAAAQHEAMYREIRR